MENNSLIDSTESLVKYLDQLDLANQPHPLLYVDLEGNNLSRHGTLALATILTETPQLTVIVDVTVLGNAAFNTAGANGQTLKDILESSEVVKIFFDVRNDSDALYAHHGVDAKGIEDLQLMELMTRSGSRRLVNGLAKCIDRDARLPWFELKKWHDVKNKSKAAFNGDFTLFDNRPLASDIKEYCIQDVALMPNLRATYRNQLCNASWKRILDEGEARVKLSQSPDFNGQGRHMALAPSWCQNWRPSSLEQLERSLLQPQAQASSSQNKTKQPEAAAASTDNIQEEAKEVNRVLDWSRYPPLSSVINRSDCDSDDVYEDDDFGCSDIGYAGFSSYDRDDNDDWKDLTACDKECGYCGKCMY